MPSGNHRADPDRLDAAVVLARFVGNRYRGGSHLFVCDHVSNYLFICRERPRLRTESDILRNTLALHVGRGGAKGFGWSGSQYISTAAGTNGSLHLVDPLRAWHLLPVAKLDDVLQTLTSDAHHG